MLKCNNTHRNIPLWQACTKHTSNRHSVCIQKKEPMLIIKHWLFLDV